jgi:crotonobetainyl-CoA:carnitine CoA-transferase CaiB-like acyl-CoA transferase
VIRVDELLEEVGLPAEPSARVTILGHDPVLPSAFPVGEAAAAVLGACGAAAASLLGIEQSVRVDVRRAAASLVGFALQRVEGGGAELERLERALVAPYECRDGRWLHLHGAFEHLAAGTCRVLGIADADGPDPAIVAGAVGRFDAQDLEDRLADARMCGAMARTAGEWAAHPQGRAMATRKRVELTPLGAAPAEPMRPGRAAPLAGIRVLDLTRVLAGPTTGRTLASHGAEVLLVNSPHLPNVLPFVVDTSHGKRSTQLDLEVPDDAARLRELVRDADVLVNGYRTGALDRFGFGPADVAALRPGIVYASVNCYGDLGPWAARPGWEQLAQTVTGIAIGNDPHERPRLIPAAACDYTTGYLTALGVVAALHRRGTEGGSWHVQSSLVQTAMWFRRIGGRCDPGAASGLGDREELTVTSDSGFGRLRHLPPVVDMSVTQPRWELPTVPIGAHPPTWAALIS